MALALTALDPAISNAPRAAFIGTAAVILIAAAIPMLSALDDEARARAQFPILVSFENPTELSRFRFLEKKDPEIVSVKDADGRSVSAMQLHLPPRKYSGFALSYFPGDWRGMHALRLLMVNPEPTPLEITVRIDDADYDSRLDLDDRYNRSFPLSPGLNQIEIALSDIATAPRYRRFDLGRVRSLLVYAVDLKQPRRIIIGPIRLLR